MDVISLITSSQFQKTLEDKMTINFSKVGPKYKHIIKKIFSLAIKKTQNTQTNLIVSLSFTNEEGIKKLNKISRGVDRVTDVLSFPMLDIKYPQKVDDFKSDIIPDGSMYLGDIVICKKRAKQQAKEYGHSLKREIGFLALHGLLHVLGYDHIDKGDEEVMSATANEILNEIGLVRGEKNV